MALDAARAGPCAGEQMEQAEPDVAGDQTQVDDIGTESEQSAVLEDETLNREDRRHDEGGGMGPEEDRWCEPWGIEACGRG